jgi:hypothetical protein
VEVRRVQVDGLAEDLCEVDFHVLLSSVSWR